MRKKLYTTQDYKKRTDAAYHRAMSGFHDKRKWKKWFNRCHKADGQFLVLKNWVCTQMPFEHFNQIKRHIFFRDFY